MAFLKVLFQDVQAKILYIDKIIKPSISWNSLSDKKNLKKMLKCVFFALKDIINFPI